MSLLEEIEQGAASDDMSIGTLLRKCLILASRLGSKPAVDWVDWELNGYPSSVPVPSYRVLPLAIKANMNDLVKQITSWPVPPEFLGEHRHAWTQFECRHGIAAIEHTLKSDKGMTLQMGNLVSFLNHLEFTHMEIHAAWGEASSGALKNLLDTVRTRVLRFALALGKEYPDAGTVRSAMPNTMSKVDQIFVNNIYGSANVVGTANHSNVVLNVTKGDFSSLKQALEQSGISAADIKELKQVLDQEPLPQASGFGPKVSAWTAKMMRKVAEGTWTMATDVAGRMLDRALNLYYGLPAS